jgi:hypothetical protein
MAGLGDGDGVDPESFFEHLFGIEDGVRGLFQFFLHLADRHGGGWLLGSGRYPAQEPQGDRKVYFHVNQLSTQI